MVETVDEDDKSSHDDDESSTDDDLTEAVDCDGGIEEELDVLYNRATQGEINLDEIMVNAAYAGKRVGVREGAARDEWRTSYVNTHNNEADLFDQIASRR